MHPEDNLALNQQTSLSVVASGSSTPLSGNPAGSIPGAYNDVKLYVGASASTQGLTCPAWSTYVPLAPNVFSEGNSGGNHLKLGFGLIDST